MQQHATEVQAVQQQLKDANMRVQVSLGIGNARALFSDVFGRAGP